MDIYIMPQKKYASEGKRIVYIKDIADVYSNKCSTEEIKNLVIYTFPEVKYGVFSVSSLDIAKKIHSKFPDATVVNEGEAEVLLEYTSEKRKENKFVLYIKISVISAILFAGGATAIMSFHADGEIPRILQAYYSIFTGKTGRTPYILQIPYSIGIAVGITVFYNHFCGKKMTYDPTPIEVQMTSYEEQVIKDQLQSVKKMENKNE